MKQRIFLFFGLLLIVAAIAAVIIPSVAICRSPAHQAATARSARRVTLSVINYQYREGRMPHSLYELPVDEIDPEVARFYDGETERYYDWLYFGQGISGREPQTGQIIIAAPMMYNGARYTDNDKQGVRVVAYGDGHIEYLDESDFREKITRQLVAQHEDTPAVATTSPAVP